MAEAQNEAKAQAAEAAAVEPGEFASLLNQEIKPKSDRAKECPDCHLINYPRLSPSIIVLVTRGDELLLAREERFQDAAATFELEKGNGRARRAQWVDVDRDGDLDLAVSCLNVPFQLYLRDGDSAACDVDRETICRTCM